MIVLSSKKYLNKGSKKYLNIKSTSVKDLNLIKGLKKCLNQGPKKVPQ